MAGSDREVFDVADGRCPHLDRIADDVADDAPLGLGHQKPRRAEEPLEGGVGPRLLERARLDPEHRQEVRTDGTPDLASGAWLGASHTPDVAGMST